MIVHSGGPMCVYNPTGRFH